MNVIQNIGIEFVLIALAIGIVLLVPKAASLLLKMAAQGAAGAIIMMGVNWLLGPMGIFVGINMVTVGVASLLGLPGVVSLYILQTIL